MPSVLYEVNWSFLVLRFTIIIPFVESSILFLMASGFIILVNIEVYYPYWLFCVVLIIRRVQGTQVYLHTLSAVRLKHTNLFITRGT